METSANNRSRGIVALLPIVFGWLLVAWGVADLDATRPNGAPVNRSEAELGALFMGFLATVLAAIGAGLAAAALRHDQRDRVARVALALGGLTIAAAIVAFRRILG